MMCFIELKSIYRTFFYSPFEEWFTLHSPLLKSELPFLRVKLNLFTFFEGESHTQGYMDKEGRIALHKSEQLYENYKSESPF